MRIDIVTLFPEMFAPLETSIVGRARENGLVEIRFFNPRDYTDDPHRKVDHPQFGGGEGMVMAAPPLLEAVEAAIGNEDRKAVRLVLLSPQGRVYEQKLAGDFGEEDRLILVCGHYKGIDDRFVELLQPEEISIGDFVLTGGEIPAMAIVDSIVRLLPEAVGGFGSVEEDSFYTGLLDCPRYTRPRSVRGIEVPSVLLGGNHEKIGGWRKRMAAEMTRQKRPDLLEKKESEK
jgi:tRNA (guanine37-N1)-methyltransferase